MLLCLLHARVRDEKNSTPLKSPVEGMGSGQSIASARHKRCANERLQSHAFIRLHNVAKQRGTSVRALVDHACHEACAGAEMLTESQFLCAAQNLGMHDTCNDSPATSSLRRLFASLGAAEGALCRHAVAAALCSPAALSSKAAPAPPVPEPCHHAHDASSTSTQQSEDVRPFTDDEFPANERALEGGRCSCPAPPVWLRPHEIACARHGGNESIRAQVHVPLFTRDPQPGDAVEGALGNCFFIAAVSVLCQRPEMVRALFPDDPSASTGASSGPATGAGVDSAAKVPGKTGMYRVRFFHDGRWVIVCVDDQLPCYPDWRARQCAHASMPAGKEGLTQAEAEVGTSCDIGAALMFGRTHNRRDLWMPILEKAYAKLYGGYGAISGGNCSEALRDLTGCAVLDLNLSTLSLRPSNSIGEMDDAELWRRMMRWSKDGGHQENVGGVMAPSKPAALIGCAQTSASTIPDLVSKSRATATMAADGSVQARGVIIHNHAYSVTRVISRRVGSSSSCEKYVQIRNPWGAIARCTGCEEETTENDGYFMLRWSDFISHFNRLYVCLLNTSSALLDGPPIGPACGGIANLAGNGVV